MNASWLAILVACSHPPAKPPPPPTPGDAATTSTGPIDAITQPVTWHIESGRVGPAELGKPLPAALAADLAPHYIARLIADAQPIDAFAFDDPPLTVIVDGPFTKANDSVEGAADRWRAKAVEAAKTAAVTRIMVTGSGPKTAAGVGVGSTLAELQQAYSDFKVAPVPPTLGKDSCVGTSKQAPGIAFVFETCGKAKSGERVTRVDIFS